MTFERKLVEQSFLPALTFPHHRQPPSPPDRIESALPRPDNFRVFQHNPPEAAVQPRQIEIDQTDPVRTFLVTEPHSTLMSMGFEKERFDCALAFDID